MNQTQKPLAQISLIAALASNGVIGRDNKMLWYLPEDLRFFKQTTLHQTILMGHKTFTSLGRALPQRRNLVLTRTPDKTTENIEYVASLDEARMFAKNELFVIGGSEIYQLTIPLAKRLLLTEIAQAYDGDCYFPTWQRDKFKCVQQTWHTSVQGLRFAFCEYQRIAEDNEPIEISL